jgi:hypothetical protein
MDADHPNTNTCAGKVCDGLTALLASRRVWLSICDFATDDEEDSKARQGKQSDTLGLCWRAGL